MGVFKWLLAPVTGPIYGGKWVVDQLVEEAERQYYDETTIRQEMLELEQWYEQGRMDQATFDRNSEALLERLLEARARRNEQDDV